MSSPRVNNIIAMGFMLAYLCVVLIGIDRSMVGEGALLHVCRVRGIENEIGTCKVLEKKNNNNKCYTNSYSAYEHQ